MGLAALPLAVSPGGHPTDHTPTPQGSGQHPEGGTSKGIPTFGSGVPPRDNTVGARRPPLRRMQHKPTPEREPLHPLDKGVGARRPTGRSAGGAASAKGPKGVERGKWLTTTQPPDDACHQPQGGVYGHQATQTRGQGWAPYSPCAKNRVPGAYEPGWGPGEPRRDSE